MDVFTICESKCDASFPDANYKPDVYSVYRHDSTSTSGGVLTWIRSDIPHRCRKDLEENNDGVQVLCIEMHIRKQKWIIISFYSLPNTTSFDTFHSSINKMSDRTCVETDMIVMIGDFNIDLLKGDIKPKTLCDIMTMNDLQNIVRRPTCFNGLLPSMIDLCIVSTPRRFDKFL